MDVLIEPVVPSSRTITLDNRLHIPGRLVQADGASMDTHGNVTSALSDIQHVPGLKVQKISRRWFRSVLLQVNCSTG